MIRLLSVLVPFRKKKYPALVSVRHEGNDICCCIRYIEKGIHYLLPHNKIKFCKNKGLIEPKDVQNEDTRDLIDGTVEAVTLELNRRVLR